MRSPYSLIYLLAFLFALSFLIAFFYLGVLSFAFEKLGLTSDSVFLLLLCSLFGSAINLPLFSIRAEPSTAASIIPPRELLRRSLKPFSGTTVIAINVGGGLIPILFSSYLLLRLPVALYEALLATTLVAMISYHFSRPIPQLGIGMPILIAPLSAALIAIVINPAHSAPLAYICGTLGVLIGADLLRLGDIRRLGASVASIGGAGTFDGIFMTGVVAVLLA